MFSHTLHHAFSLYEQIRSFVRTPSFFQTILTLFYLVARHQSNSKQTKRNPFAIHVVFGAVPTWKSRHFPYCPAFIRLDRKKGSHPVDCPLCQPGKMDQACKQIIKYRNGSDTCRIPSDGFVYFIEWYDTPSRMKSMCIHAWLTKKWQIHIKFTLFSLVFSYECQYGSRIGWLHKGLLVYWLLHGTEIERQTFENLEI